MARTGSGPCVHVGVHERLQVSSLLGVLYSSFAHQCIACLTFNTPCTRRCFVCTLHSLYDNLQNLETWNQVPRHPAIDTPHPLATSSNILLTCTILAQHNSLALSLSIYEWRHQPSARSIAPLSLVPAQLSYHSPQDHSGLSPRASLLTAHASQHLSQDSGLLLQDSRQWQA